MSLILAIDDDENLLKVVEKQLNKSDYKVVLASSGKKGLELAKTGNPDLILLDLMMPEMDGFAVLKELQKDDVTKNIPVIMLTSKSDKEDVVSAMRMGVSDYVVKPHNYAVLPKKIETAINYKKIQIEEERDEQTQFIDIVRKNHRTVISFKSSLQDKRVLEEMKSVFNRGFFNIIAKDIIVVDLRSLQDLEESELDILMKIVILFSTKDLYVVAGRHYGTIMANCDFNENVELFISPGDLELAILKNQH